VRGILFDLPIAVDTYHRSKSRFESCGKDKLLIMSLAHLLSILTSLLRCWSCNLTVKSLLVPFLCLKVDVHITQRSDTNAQQCPLRQRLEVEVQFANPFLHRPFPSGTCREYICGWTLKFPHTTKLRIVKIERRRPPATSNFYDNRVERQTLSKGTTIRWTRNELEDTKGSGRKEGNTLWW